MDGFQRHFDSQVLIYGKQTILNLVSNIFQALLICCSFLNNTHVFFFVFFFQVNQKGSEKPLEQAFSKMVSGMNNGMLKWVSPLPSFADGTEKNEGDGKSACPLASKKDWTGALDTIH